MMIGLSPADLNAAARLVVMAAERCGPQLLDDAESFDEVFGRGRFAGLDCEVQCEMCGRIWMVN